MFPQNHLLHVQTKGWVTLFANWVGWLLRDTRPEGNDVLDVAGCTVFPRGDPRWNDCVSVTVSPISLPEYDAERV